MPGARLDAGEAEVEPGVIGEGPPRLFSRAPGLDEVPDVDQRDHVRGSDLRVRREEGGHRLELLGRLLVARLPEERLGEVQAGGGEARREAQRLARFSLRL